LICQALFQGQAEHLEEQFVSGDVPIGAPELDVRLGLGFGHPATPQFRHHTLDELGGHGEGSGYSLALAELPR